ncbi:hypothetical protein GBAR_LOCUS21342 [Geodia barretti]|uniref:Uncharacterized protein n=2 Tax=Geodia barretti TaxID=519541 RepID=A0AA35SZ15_GEOBA|nr:hypothetical protein GBAR_LOCUS21342 [Geodia barretti]
MPPVLYRQAKDCRHGWTRRKIQRKIRNSELAHNSCNSM